MVVILTTEPSPGMIQVCFPFSPFLVFAEYLPPLTMLQQSEKTSKKDTVDGTLVHRVGTCPSKYTITFSKPTPQKSKIDTK